MPDFPAIMHRRLLLAREARGYETQPEFARQTGIAVSQISHWETGERQPTVANLRRLCLALDIKMDWVVGLSNEAPDWLQR